MSEENSNKIIFLNYLLACMIVLIHSCDIYKTVEFSAVSPVGGVSQYRYVQRLGDVLFQHILLFPVIYFLEGAQRKILSQN